MATDYMGHEPVDLADLPRQHVTEDEFHAASMDWGSVVVISATEWAVARDHEVIVLDRTLAIA